MTDASTVATWPALSFTDARVMLTWLGAIGFTEHAAYYDQTDPTVLNHAELLWPHGGGLMAGSLRPDGAVRNVGGSAIYLVCPDPDDVHARALAAGATELRAPRDEEYGGRGSSVADPEGNHWSFGTYQPA